MNTFLRILSVFACVLLLAIPIGGQVVLILNATGWVLAVMSVFQLMLTVFAIGATVVLLQMVWDMTRKEG